MPHFTTLYHAAMAGRSSLLAAVIRHTRSRAASFSVITGPDWHTPAQVTRSSPDQEKTSANSSLAQSDDADRSLSAVDLSSLRHPHRLCRPAQHSGKVGSGLSKRPPYSGVQRCRQLHAAITLWVPNRHPYEATWANSSNQFRRAGRSIGGEGRVVMWP
jgi:hypothetical protein